MRILWLAVLALLLEAGWLMLWPVASTLSHSAAFTAAFLDTHEPARRLLARLLDAARPVLPDLAATPLTEPLGASTYLAPAGALVAVLAWLAVWYVAALMLLDRAVRPPDASRKWQRFTPGAEVNPSTRAAIVPGAEVNDPSTRAASVSGPEVNDPSTRAASVPGAEVNRPSAHAAVVPGAEVNDPSARAAVWVVLGGALAFQATLLWLPGLFSQDVFSYIAYGHLAALYDLNPYVWPPSAVAKDAVVPWVADVWRSYASPYGPLWTDVQWVVARVFGRQPVADEAMAYRVLANALLVANLGLAWAVLGRVFPVERARRTTALAALAWNPLLLFELAANAHNDVLMVTFSLLALLLLARPHPARPTPPRAHSTPPNAHSTPPSARPTLPAARFTLPGARFTLLGARFTLPRARFTLPGARFTLPRARPTLSEARFSKHGGRFAFPGARVTLPGGHFSLPGGRSTLPGAGFVRAGVSFAMPRASFVLAGVSFTLGALVKYLSGLGLIWVALAAGARSGARTARLVRVGAIVLISGAIALGVLGPWLELPDSLDPLAAETAGVGYVNALPDTLALGIADNLLTPAGMPMPVAHDMARAFERIIVLISFGAYLIWESRQVWSTSAASERGERSQSAIVEAVARAVARSSLIYILLVSTSMQTWYLCLPVAMTIILGWRSALTRVTIAYSLLALPALYLKYYLRESTPFWVDAIYGLGPLVLLAPACLRVLRARARSHEPAAQAVGDDRQRARRHGVTRAIVKQGRR